ncbi:xanthine dehydrogenase accessory protein XdhC [Salinarimonas rosea]|uniref:xanthine dehydrogenase accessory protein XdhC n=1 Tax=Salinarimonas rosea TaxID=552063 RepID=UPI000413DD1A|nr:xanthine dehydrogenase accessory protein XdhC [Salinarimonas rosea]
MTSAYARLADLVAAHGAAALVRVASVQGSAPREAGAAMAVRPDGAFHGTIGGGELEWRALSEARTALAEGRGRLRRLDMALGPDLGQCCGGRAVVTIETFDARDLDELRMIAEAAAEGRPLAARTGADGRVRRVPTPIPTRRGGAEAPDAAVAWLEETAPAQTPLLLFGAGHVGRALVLALAPLPFRVRWVDGRADAFPAHVPGGTTAIHSDEPGLEIAQAPPGAFVLVMTHSHPLDMALTAAALGRTDLPFVGLIGSATKRARFERRFREIGLPETRIAALACPIGLPGIRAKDPASIAAATAAQLLLARDRTLSADPPGPSS